MITFATLQERLLEHIRLRVRNGELTERGLSRMVGVSQPHMHNVLKGVRALSPDLGDQLLVHLRISLIDLLSRVEISCHTGLDTQEHYESSYIPVLADPIGPGFPWPRKTGKPKRFLIDRQKLSSFLHPIVGRLAPDPRMLPAIFAGDFGLLDQNLHARRQVEPDALFMVKFGEQALIRRIRLGSAGVLYLATEDSLGTPAGWQKVHLAGRDISHVVRARVHLIAPDREDWWEEPPARQRSA